MMCPALQFAWCCLSSFSPRAPSQGQATRVFSQAAGAVADLSCSSKTWKEAATWYTSSPQRQISPRSCAAFAVSDDSPSCSWRVQPAKKVHLPTRTSQAAREGATFSGRSP